MKRTTKKTKKRNGHVDREWIKRVIAGRAFFNWNQWAITKRVRVGEPAIEQLKKVELRSECLRDGVGAFALMPNVEDKKQYIHTLSEAGVKLVTVDIFSSTSIAELSSQNLETLQLLEWMKVAHPKLIPVVLARAHENDIAYLKLCRKANRNLTAIVFQDLSEVRRIVENWGSFTEVLGRLKEKVVEAKRAGVKVMAFTENLSITKPSEVRRYVNAMCEAGADWVGISDTAGRLIPVGAYGLVTYVQKAIDTYWKRHKVVSVKKIGIVFHGHNDLGNAVANSMAAVAAGASILDVVVNGLGERVGNTNLNEVIGNVEYRLRMAGEGGRFDLKKLVELSTLFSRITGTQLELQQPLISHRVFTTYFGIHANYFLKVAVLASNMRDDKVDETLVKLFLREAWKVYSALSPDDLGYVPDIRVSHLSGAANVILRLHRLGLIEDVRELAKNNGVIQAVLLRAKGKLQALSDEDLTQVWRDQLEQEGD